MRRIVTSLGYCLLLALLSGCAAVGTIAASTAIAKFSDDECNAKNLLMSGNFCIAPPTTPERAPVFCYKTLGGIDCYALPDPYPPHDTARVVPSQPLTSPAPRAMPAPITELAPAAKMPAAKSENTYPPAVPAL